MTDCSFEYITLHTDSISGDSWINGSQSQFTSHLYRPIKDIVEVTLVSCSLDISNSNVAYIKVDEFESHFNMNTLTPALASDPPAKSKTSGSLARILCSSSGRTEFKQYDFDTQVLFNNPIRKLDRITSRIYNEDGDVAAVTSNVFITYKLKCKRENMCI